MQGPLSSLINPGSTKKRHVRVRLFSSRTLRRVAEGELTAEAWRQQLEAAGVAELPLVG